MRPGCAITDRLAYADVANLQNPGLQPHHPLHGIGAALESATPIERDAGAHEIEMVIGAEERATRIGQARRSRRQLRPQRPKACELRGIGRAVRLVRTRQMAHDERQFKALEKPPLYASQCLDLRGGEPHPVDAGVDMNGGPQPPSRGVTIGGPSFSKWRAMSITS